MRLKAVSLCTASLLTGSLAIASWTAPVADAARPSFSVVQASEASASATSLTGGHRIKWGKCAKGSFLRFVGAQCGFLRVPLDYADPQGRTISLAVSRYRHTSSDADYQGVMLVNPGGPGGSGLIFAVLGLFMPKGSASGTYDWIGFDPRGVGSSKPAISCKPRYFHPDRPPYVPATDAIRLRWLHRAESYADACHAANPALLKHMHTTDSARDMNSIRQALGARRINYYGYSYGTYLGQVFATMFPDRVRRMVLDSNVDPRRVFYHLNLDQDRAVQRVADRWFTWVADHHKRYHLGRTQFHVEHRFYRTEQKLYRKPAGGVVGPAEWLDAMLAVAYGQYAWPDRAAVWSSWVNDHKPVPLIRRYRGADTPGNDNLFAVYNAVECTDAPWPQRWRRWAHDNWRVNRVAPFYTWANAWFNASCREWAVQAQRPVHVDGHGVRALLLDETYDAATPFQGSLEVRSRFKHARLVATRGGTTHAASPFSTGPCVNERIADFLKSGALPKRAPGRRADVYCKGGSPPLRESRTQRSASLESARSMLLSALRRIPPP